MRRDKNAPALYELIRDKPAAGKPMPPPSRVAPPAVTTRPAAVKPPPAPRPVDDTERPASILTPGRSVRIPLGYFIPVAILLLVAVVGAYTVGYQRRDAEQKVVEQRESAQALDAVDPLASVPVNPQILNPPANAAPRQPAPANPQPRQAANTTPPKPDTVARPAPSTATPPPTSGQPVRQPTATPASGPPAQTTPANPAPANTAPAPVGGTTRPKGVVIVSSPADDPRQVGLNYLIAATLTADEAEKAAQFLVSRGLDAAVVPADGRGSQRWVVILEGLAAKDLGSSRARTLENRLQDLGRVYRQELKGPTVFNDPWWKKHVAPGTAGDSGASDE